jgi:hypothetical protein
MREARSKQDRSGFPSQDYFQAGIYAGAPGLRRPFAATNAKNAPFRSRLAL